MTLKVTILGCGNSSGVPSIGNFWGACDPLEPKNRRTRCCLAVQSKKTNVIIDTGADIRYQVNNLDIDRIDMVLYTHQHSDHSHGIDDLRPLYFRNGRSCMECRGGEVALNEIRERFRYLFDGGVHADLYPPILKAFPFAEEDYGRTLCCNDIEYIPFLMDHGTCQSVGYRFGDVSYCVDMKALDQAALDIIKGSRVWIVDGAGYHKSDNPAHADLETLYRYNDYIQADRVYVTSLSSMMDYKTLEGELPEGFFSAYDGLTTSCKP
ncbi:MAG: MBL fold metallo-hydrolase [Alphaproteobacteria bacterium]